MTAQIIPFQPRVNAFCWSPKPPGFYRCERLTDGQMRLHGPGHGFLSGYFDIHTWNFRWLFSEHTWDKPIARYDIWIDEAYFFELLSKKEVRGKTLLEWIREMRPRQYVEFCRANRVSSPVVLSRIKRKADLFFQ